MKTKESFNHSILKVNNDESLSTNKHELNAILRILRDESEEFLIEKRKLQISINKIDECIKEHHDESLQRHLEVTKTLQLLRQHCQFPNMRQAVETYVKRCLSCQQNKHGTHASYGEIQYQELSESPWDEVTMNFITKLLKSTNPATGDRYDSILIMIDKLTKYSHIIACKKKFTAEQLRYIVLNRLIKYHDILKGLTSDRDKLFTSNY
jgi:hypothetical protein